MRPLADVLMSVLAHLPAILSLLLCYPLYTPGAPPFSGTLAADSQPEGWLHRRAPPLKGRRPHVASVQRRSGEPSSSVEPTFRLVQDGEAVGSAEWVARRVQDRDTGRDGRMEMRMRLVDPHRRVRERALTLTMLRGGRGRAAGDAPDGDRLLVRFTYPNDIKGTSFLVWEHPDAEDERFLYLPALARVRRIAGAESQESFVGSDFTYEDIGGREFGDYTYRMVNANDTWTSPGGAPRPAYRLESRRKDRDAAYPRVVSLVLKDSFVVTHADIVNRRNDRQKIFDVRRLDRIEGIWTVMDMVMVDERDATRTEIAVVRADYNIGLTASDFSRRELERGAR